VRIVPLPAMRHGVGVGLITMAMYLQEA
jgi:hypothetical protein